MVNLREAYRRSDEKMPMLFALTLTIIAIGTIGIVFTSPLTVLGGLVALFFIVLTILKPLTSLTILSVFLPFEPFVLKWIPDEIYLYARVFSEALIYLIFAVAVVRAFLDGKKVIENPMNLPFVLLLVVLASSAVINWVDPTIAIVGIRQIIRYMLLFYAVLLLDPSRTYIKRLVVIMLSVAALQAGIGIAQAVLGAPLDSFLLPSQTRTFGEFTLTEGTVQFWDPGSRVFATLGRYDRLGTFLGFFLLIGVGLLYEKRIRTERKELWWLFLLGLPALALTYSRSSWFGFLLGFLFLALIIKRDRKVMVGVGICAAIIAGYLAYSGLVVSKLIDTPSQTFVERFFEAFSVERWSGEYYGLGRLYWIVQTVTTVIPASPLFGFGPGTYGGGAAILFRNTEVYDQLGLPFGVYGSEGYLDNNWFSLWGETGTIGFALYLWLYLGLFVYALRVHKRSDDDFTRAIALGVAGAMIAVALNAFLATFLEVRSLAVYLWMFAAFVVLLGRHERIA